MKYFHMLFFLANANYFSTYVASNFNTGMVNHLIRFVSLLVMSFKIGGMHHLIADRALDICQLSLITMLMIDMTSHGRNWHNFSTNWARWFDIMNFLLVTSKEVFEHDFMANVTFDLVLANQDAVGWVLDTRLLLWYMFHITWHMFHTTWYLFFVNYMLL
jgi:hypothetical protein